VLPARQRCCIPCQPSCRRVALGSPRGQITTSVRPRTCKPTRSGSRQRGWVVTTTTPHSWNPASSSLQALPSGRGLACGKAGGSGRRPWEPPGLEAGGSVRLRHIAAGNAEAAWTGCGLARAILMLSLHRWTCAVDHREAIFGRVASTRAMARAMVSNPNSWAVRGPSCSRWRRGGMP
jgi:hypothetical protein